MQFIEEVNMNWNKISPQLKSTLEKENKHISPMTQSIRGSYSLPLVCGKMCLAMRLCHSDNEFFIKRASGQKYHGNWANNGLAFLRPHLAWHAVGNRERDNDYSL